MSQFKIIFYDILNSARNFMTKLTTAFINFFSTYSEVLRTGGIQTTATGEKIIINYQANVCGDILIFMGPRHSDHSRVDLIEHVRNLILSDSTLKQKNELALESLSQKFQILMILPKMITGFISVILSLLVYWKALNIQAFLNYQIDPGVIQKVIPFVLFIIMFIFWKFIGFKVIAVVVWLINFLKLIWQRLKAIISVIVPSNT